MNKERRKSKEVSEREEEKMALLKCSALMQQLGIAGNVILDTMNVESKNILLIQCA